MSECDTNKTKKSAHFLKTFSKTALDAYGWKLKASTDAACSERAYAFGSFGRRGVPCSAYLAAI